VQTTTALRQTLAAARRGSMARAEVRLALALVIPALVIPALLMLTLLFGFFLSFTDWRLTTGYQGFVYLENYQWLVENEQFWFGWLVTLKYAVVDVTTEILLGTLLALLLNEALPGIRFWRAAVILPLMIPPVVGALIWKVLMRAGPGGFFNYLLSFVGVPPQGWIGDPSQVLYSLVLIDVWLNTPFVATILLAGLQSLPREPFDAAQVDGASSWQILRFVTLPLLLPFYIVVFFFRSIDALNSFDLIYATTSGGPGIASRTLAIMAYEEGFPRLNLSVGTAAILVLWMACMVVGSVLYRHVSRHREQI
jgi:multiple sugar transport system permease protein